MKHLKIIPLSICCFFSIGAGAQTAPNPPTDFRTQIDQYRHGQKNYPKMPALSETAKKANWIALSDSIAEDYAKNYLYKLKDSELTNKEHIQFILAHPKLIGSHQHSYLLFTKYAEQTDSLMHDPTQSQRVIDFIISKEVLNPAINKSKKLHIEPSWKALTITIEKKIGRQFANASVLTARTDWYKEHKDWKKYTKYLTEQMNRTTFTKDLFQGPVRFNHAAWEIFDFSDNRQELEDALSWSTKVVGALPQAESLDTKANLLYKLGRIKEAIIIETNASIAEPNAQDIKTNLDKMKKGERTWTVPEGLIN